MRSTPQRGAAAPLPWHTLLALGLVALTGVSALASGGPPWLGALCLVSAALGAIPSPHARGRSSGHHPPPAPVPHPSPGDPAREVSVGAVIAHAIALGEELEDASERSRATLQASAVALDELDEGLGAVKQALVAVREALQPRPSGGTEPVRAPQADSSRRGPTHRPAT